MRNGIVTVILIKTLIVHYALWILDSLRGRDHISVEHARFVNNKTDVGNYVLTLPSLHF